jgi:hypothetical protein
MKASQIFRNSALRPPAAPQRCPLFSRAAAFVCSSLSGDRPRGSRICGTCRVPFDVRGRSARCAAMPVEDAGGRVSRTLPEIAQPSNDATRPARWPRTGRSLRQIHWEAMLLFTRAPWNWHPYAVGHTPGSQFCCDRRAGPMVRIRLPPTASLRTLGPPLIRVNSRRGDDNRFRPCRAIAKRTYKAYRSLLDSPRWQRIYNAGARPQRLLWASTGELWQRPR